MAFAVAHARTKRIKMIDPVTGKEEYMEPDLYDSSYLQSIDLGDGAAAQVDDATKAGPHQTLAPRPHRHRHCLAQTLAPRPHHRCPNPGPSTPLLPKPWPLNPTATAAQTLAPIPHCRPNPSP